MANGEKRITCRRCRKKFHILVGNKNNGRQVKVVCPHCRAPQNLIMK